MTRPILHFFIFYAFLVTNFSCTKTDNTDPQGIYQSTGILINETAVLYTINGESTDQALIRQVAARDGTPDHFAFDPTTSSYTNGPSSLTFYEKNKVDIRYLTGEKVGAEITERTEKQLMITQVDSFIFGPIFTGSHCFTVGQKIIQYLPNVNCGYIKSGDPVPSKLCRYRRAFPVLLSGKEVHYPVLNYIIYSASGGRCTSIGTGQVNMFNKSGLSELIAGDTLIIQFRRLRLVKQE